MTRRKLDRFAYNEFSPLVIQVGKPLYTTVKGKWKSAVFGNTHPIIVELGCGKGEYTIGLAQRNSDVNYIGIDIKGDRIARGAYQAEVLQLKNVAFLRADVRFLTEFFEECELDGIWITFPDPHEGDRAKKRRLTSPQLLEVYYRLLSDSASVHLKTDNEEFFAYTMSLVRDFPCRWRIDGYTNDLYSSELNRFQWDLKTKYEKEFFSKGFSIKYVVFSKLVCSNIQS